MEKQFAKTGIQGVAIIEKSGQLGGHWGVVSDPRVRTHLFDAEWLKQATERRLTVMQFSDVRYSVVAAPLDGGALIILFPEQGEITQKFLLGVDFAFDIIEHLLGDPFDAMVMIDAKEKLAFVSPIHEKFFGLKPGEGVGRKVRDVIENTRLHHVVRTGVAEIGQIQKMNGRERVVSRHPIRRDGKVIGAIGRVMFKGPQQVEALAKRISALEQEIETYRASSMQSSQAEAFLDAIVGQSPAVISLRDQIRKIAPLDIPVLIQGESGTGKELVAQALHMMSARHDERLVTVNAAALPAQLVESELFGYEAGAFTGADKKGRAGKFEQADKGTIFMDEIGDMPLEVQSKLLRVLQDRIVERVGGDKPRKIDFRLISATNRDLEEFVGLRKFRLDLYYRVSPVVIRTPSLSERIEDIPLLVRSFLPVFAAQYGREEPEVDSDAIDYLMEREWPGNVRELRHSVERAFVFCEEGRMKRSDFRGAAVGAGENSLGVANGRLREALDRYEHDILSEAMVRFGGNKSRVADHLGVSRSYLYKKLDDINN